MSDYSNWMVRLDTLTECGHPEGQELWLISGCTMVTEFVRVRVVWMPLDASLWRFFFKNGSKSSLSLVHRRILASLISIWVYAWGVGRLIIISPGAAIYWHVMCTMMEGYKVLLNDLWKSLRKWTRPTWKTDICISQKRYAVLLVMLGEWSDKHLITGKIWQYIQWIVSK